MTLLPRFTKNFLLLLLFIGSADARLKVASLHPLMTDLAQQVGGEHVEVTGLVGANADPHHFQPSPKILANAKGAKIYLASGKNMESYLSELRDTLGSSAAILEVGKKIPSLTLSARDVHYVCCPNHANGGIDPHWWHKVSNMQRAAKIVAKAFSQADPAHASAYEANAVTYSRRLGSLDAWIKREVSRIPRKDRVLSTAHAAFNYFCKEYGFKALPIKGLTVRHKTDASHQAEVIKAIRSNGVRAIFPEQRANPKALRMVAKETGTKMGGVLIADGATSYEKMMQSNVNSIVKSLSR